MILVKHTLNRMTSLEGTCTEQVILFILLLATETDNKPESENCYFLIYNFFMQIMRSESQNFAHLTLYDVSVTS